jgi:HSP20 family protein
LSNDDIRKKIEDLSEEVKQRKNEIEKIEISLKELNEKIQKNKQIDENSDLKKMVNDVSDLFNLTFSTMGVSGKASDNNKNGGGFIDIINRLSELSENTEYVKKEFDVAGKKGVFEYKINARPIKGHIVGHSSLNNKRPSKEPSLGLKLGDLPKSIDNNEPLIEITENVDDITIIAELPNLDEKKITVDVDLDRLKINTGLKNKDFIEITLPEKVDKTDVKKKYENGILEINLKKLKMK